MFGALVEGFEERKQWSELLETLLWRNLEKAASSHSQEDITKHEVPSVMKDAIHILINTPQLIHNSVSTGHAIHFSS